MTLTSDNYTLELIIGRTNYENTDLRAAIHHLMNEGAQIGISIIDREKHEIELARKAAERPLHALVAVGGDGTLGNVVNGVCSMGFRPSGLGVIPMGTANDFATSAGIPSDYLEALKIILDNEPQAIDVGKMNDKFFLNVASGGFGAEITASTPDETKQLLGGFAYFLTGILNFNDLSAKPLHIKAPAFSYRESVFAVSIGNGKQAGGGFQVCPRALVNDGMLDLMIIPELAIDQLVLFIRDLMRFGSNPKLDSIIYQQVKWVEIYSEEDLHVNLDGEPYKGDHFRFDLHHSKLPFYLPQGSPLLRNNG